MLVIEAGAHPVRRLCRLLQTIASALAPASERKTWNREWDAELEYLWNRSATEGRLGARGAAKLLGAGCGAIAHALWLRGQRWRPDMLMQDVRFALRSLIKRPMFTVVVVLTIALGIGVNAAIFSVLYDVVLEPLPYDDPEELVMVWEHNIPRDNRTNVVAPANFFVWREDTSVFEELAAVTWFSQALTGTDEPERVGTVAANWNLFPALGVQPHRGRFFTADEDDPASTARPVVLSHAFWTQRYGGDESAIGRTLQLNGTDHTIVGVLPPGFRFDHLPFSVNSTGTQDVWMPQAFDERLRDWRGRWLQVVGRLKSDVTLEQARAELATVASRLEQEFPDQQTGWTANIVPLHRQIVGEARTALVILFGAVTLVLLIACGNVANLLLSRSTERAGEMAVRTALGADRMRVMRQLLTESGMLAAAGGGLGLLLAYGLVRALVALGPDLPRLAEIGLGGTVVGFTLLVSAITGLLFGLLPAMRASRADLISSLKDGSRRAGSGAGVIRARNGLVVSEIALALVLLVGSGLLIRSFANLVQQGVGFEAEGMMTAEIELSSRDYPEPEARTQLFESVVDRVAAAPGITAASAITNLPLSGAATGTTFWLNDRELPADGEFPAADIRWVHRDYHATMGIPILRGRAFDASDTGDAPMRVVINAYMADLHWPGADPIGRTLSMPWGDTLVAEVVGVAGNVRHDGPDGELREKLYWHHLQWPERSSMTIVARTEGDPTPHAATIRGAVREMDPNLALYNVHPMSYWMSETMASRRFVMLALGAFALVALLLASVGVYGVMSYNVSQRTREFGVRLALGARKRDVALGVVGAGLRLVLIAVFIGTIGALALGRLLQSLVYGIGTTDLPSFAFAALFLIAVAVAACYWPAHRAGRVDPIEALRFE
ncbi:MAG: ABC transporter permease [Gemmatimonadetes bacterium]|nr:ABC transporter permease [Gemmatimonadota bacterium]